MDEQNNDQPEMQTVVVDHADKWPEAVTVTDKQILDTFGGKMQFDIRAMSYAEYLATDTEVPEPIQPTKEINGREVPDSENEAYIQAQGENTFKRMVRAIDMCWKPLPGANLGEKVKWAQENFWREGEIIQLYHGIMRLSGLGSGAPVDRTANVPVLSADPETWARQTHMRVGYRIARAGVYLIFEMSGLSQIKQTQILTATRPPDPPVKPKKNRLTGRAEGSYADHNDEKYLRACSEMANFERVLKLEASLPFVLPGETNESKHEWLGKRPAFEVLNLVTHLNHNVLAYRERADFI